MAATRNTFCGNPLDRAAEWRLQPEWLAERAEDPSSEVLLFWQAKPLMVDDGSRLARVSGDMARELAGGAEEFLFLGMDGEAAVFAVEVETPDDPSAGPLATFGRFEGLREAAALLKPAEAAIAAEAKAVFEWRRRHAFCSACGHCSETAEAGWKRTCPNCRTDHFPRTDPVTIMLPVRGDRCLVGRQSSWPPGRYSALAGFVEPGESLEEACAREVWEEAGLRVLATTYHSSQPWPFPTNLMIGLIAEVDEGEARPDQTELEAVRWLTRAEARDLLAGRLEPELHAPPPLAIAHQLLKTWSLLPASGEGTNPRGGEAGVGVSALLRRT